MMNTHCAYDGETTAHEVGGNDARLAVLSVGHTHVHTVLAEDANEAACVLVFRILRVHGTQSVDDRGQHSQHLLRGILHRLHHEGNELFALHAASANQPQVAPE